MIQLCGAPVDSTMIKTFAPLALAACALVACSDTSQNSAPRGAERAERAVGVIAQEVVLEREAERIEALGTARAMASATIFPDASGEVERVAFAAGDRVEAGDILLELEADEERLAVRLSEVAVREAEQLLARYRRIEDTGAISDSQIDEAVTALEAAEIQLEQAQVALDRRTVRAPFEGYVGLTDIDAGARITPTTEITELDNRSTLYVDFNPPEQVFGRINVGDVVQAEPFAGPTRSYDARIINVDSRINPTARTFTVRASLDNALDQLRPGMSFAVNFEVLADAWPVVPEAAISWGSDGAYVWVIEDDRARQKPITLVQRRQGAVLVSGDFGDGALVVAEGVQRMREGVLVELIEVRQASDDPQMASAGLDSVSQGALAQ